jgi:Domain of unknown function (DUF4440)
MTGSIDSFLGEWSAAERAGDTGNPCSLLAEDFVGIRPVGFSLSTAERLARHQQGARYESFGLGETTVRAHGDAAIGTARHTRRGAAMGSPRPRSRPSHLRPRPPRGAVAPGQRSHEPHRQHPRCTIHPRHRPPATTSSGCRRSIPDHHIIPGHRQFPPASGQPPAPSPPVPVIAGDARRARHRGSPAAGACGRRLGLGRPRQESDCVHLSVAVDIAGGEIML